MTYEQNEIERVLNDETQHSEYYRLKIESYMESTRWLNVTREDVLAIQKQLADKF